MEIDVTEYKRFDMVKLKGRLDGDTVHGLQEAFDNILNANKYNILLDMSEVTFVSSAGWWLLIDTQKKCRRYKRGELVMACLDSRIRNSLDLVGMGDYFKVYDTIVDAAGNF